jgi:arginyl-tRNA synthetase
MEYKNIIAQRINEKTNLGVELIESLIEIPPKPEMGDFAFPCFQLSKTMRKSPNLIAEELSKQLNLEGFEKITNLGGYLNFFADKSSYTKNAIEKVLNEKDNYGTSTLGNGKNVIVEYSSPNIAKSFHVGHLCSTAIGHALYNIIKSQGYNCIGINHLGDWGTQFGRLIVGYKNWINEDALDKEPIKELSRIYVKFYEEAEKNPELDNEARLHFKNLEDGLPEETMLWQKFKDLSMKEFNRVYDMLGVKFDSFAGESFYSDKMDAVVDEIEIKGLLTDSDGAQIVDLDAYNIPPCLIKKSDGATIYATRDLTAAIYRKKTYDFYKNIYVVGTPQALHFKQIFTTLSLMGHEWSKDCVHIGFGLVKFADKKLASRTGDVILLEDALNEGAKRALNLIEQKNPNLENKEEVARKVGIGSIVFAYLKNNRERDIVFNWDDILNFEGETGPYIQYTYARSKSILRKSADFRAEAEYHKLSTAPEFELVKNISDFSNAINNAIDKYEPSILTRYIINVAQDFNKFYNQCPIMSCEDAGLKASRLKLVEATTYVLKNGLEMLGIQVVEKM